MYFRKKYGQIHSMHHVSPCGCIYTSICLAFMRIMQEMSHEQYNELKGSNHYKTFLAANFSLFIKSSLDNLAYEASLHRVVTYAIYSATCIIVLGQLLIRLLILIKQSLPRRKHHLFNHWADGINTVQCGPRKKIESKFDITLILSILMQLEKHSFAKYHWIKFQIKLAFS